MGSFLEALLDGAYSHADICLFNKYLLNAYYVQLLDRAMNKTGIPALGELPVQLTDAHNIHTHARTGTHNLQAHRGAQTQNSLPASSSHATCTSQGDTNPRSTGELRDLHYLETHDYGSAHKQVTLDL